MFSFYINIDSKCLNIRCALKICSKFTGEQSNVIELALRHRYSPVNLMHISRTHFLKNTSGWLLLHNANNIYFIIFLQDS